MLLHYVFMDNKDYDWYSVHDDDVYTEQKVSINFKIDSQALLFLQS